MRTTLQRSDPVDEWAIEAVVTHPVFEELFEQIVGDAPTGDMDIAASSPGGWPRRHLARRALLAGAAAIVVVLGALAGTARSGAGAGSAGLS